nr:InlB B-repeat-containing protein [Bacteroidales bacterium]
MAMSIRKYIYASLALICLMCSCDPWLVPPVKITYEEDANGYKYVDLGLSVKWAAYDIGANSATELGDFFAWGETQPKKDYSWDTYKFAVPYKSPESDTRSFDNGYGKEYELTKYNLDPNSEYYDGKTTLDLIDDAAHMAWGGNWRMPTVSECNELVEKCEWTWTEYLGVEGYDVKGPNGNRMFLPDMEGRDMLYQDGTWLARWSSNCLNNNDNYYNPESWAYMMVGNGFGDAKRFLGLFVRAVYDKSLPKYSVLTFDANGGEGLMHPQQFNKGVSQSIDSVRYTNGILNFVAWNTQPDGSGQSFANGQEITLDKNTTLYAQWALATGSENGYDYVDLGLPSGTKWAIYNVGATSPEGFGDYFAWGETQAKDSYSWDNYKFGNSDNNLTKYVSYNSWSSNDFVDDRTQLEMIDDAAHINWGGNWRMPTKEEMEELIAYTTVKIASVNGVKGTMIISKLNKNIIFLPTTSYREADGELHASSNGNLFEACYWSNTVAYRSSAYNLYHPVPSDDYVYDLERTSSERCIGLPVRAVFNGELPAYYTVTFDANGGEGYMPQREYYQGKEQALPACAFTRFGYLFDGWNTAPDGSGISYKDAVLISVDAPLTLYAQWKRDPSMGEENGYFWVDLGLSVKWATCNVGATTPENPGDFFAWGELASKEAYGNYDTYNRALRDKYFADENTKFLELIDDAAHMNMGGNWRMPTPTEMQELINNCTWEWVNENREQTIGYRVTSKINGNSIFLPTKSRGSYYDGYYWSSQTYSNARAVDLEIGSWDKLEISNRGIYYGYAVRAVCANETLATTYLVKFDANGAESGQTFAQGFYAGQAQTLNACGFTKEGYYLDSWNTRPDGSGRAYAPGISLTPTENMILYAQWAKRSASGTENGHEWVDLGLSVKWATYNVGATTPEGFGDYFAWGETAPKESYLFESYKHGGIYEQGTDRVCRLYKYCLEAEDGYNGFVDNKSELELVDDAAHVNWGGNGVFLQKKKLKN